MNSQAWGASAPRSAWDESPIKNGRARERLAEEKGTPIGRGGRRKRLAPEPILRGGVEVRVRFVNWRTCRGTLAWDVDGPDAVVWVTDGPLAGQLLTVPTAAVEVIACRPS